MIKKESITLSQEEILDIADLLDVDFNHERNAPAPAGIKGILNSFIDHERNKVDEKKVAQLIIKHLRDKEIITGEKKCNYKFNCTHTWGAYDDEGYAPSVCRVSLEVYRQIVV